MRIAFYCPNKPLTHPHPSGDLVIAQSIQQALNQLGHDCQEMVRFRSRWFWTTASAWFEAASSLWRAYQRALRFAPDLWLSYHTYYKSPDVIGPWVSRLLHIPYVLFQPMYATRRRKVGKTRLGFYANRMAIDTCSHAFTNNLDDLEALLRILPAKRLTYLPPGIFPEDFRRDSAVGRAVRKRYGIAETVPLLLTAARFRQDVKFQSLVYLFNALKILKKNCQTFMLLVVGDGPMADQLHKMAQEQLPGKVVFAGAVLRNNMARFYSAADLFVFPGIGESLGMVFLEAQACGLPVVALDTAGVPQVVMANQTGLLVPEDGGEQMAYAIEALLKDSERRSRLAASGPDFIAEQRNLHRNYVILAKKLEAIRAASDSRTGKRQ